MDMKAITKILVVAPAPVLTHSAFCVTCEQKSGLFELNELA